MVVVGVGYSSSPQADVPGVTAFCDRGRQKLQPPLAQRNPDCKPTTKSLSRSLSLVVVNGLIN
jgi:hypothetical protein